MRIPTALSALVLFGLLGAARAGDPAPAPEFVTQRYRVADLLRPPAEVPVPGLLGGQQGGCVGIAFDIPDSEPEWTVDTLVEYVQTSVAPDSWNTPGVRLRIAGHALEITHRPEAQRQVQALLQGLRSERGTVCLEARCLALPPEAWRKIRGEGGMVLTDAHLKALEEAVTSGTARVLAEGRTMGREGHRATLMSVRSRAYLQDLTAVVQVASNLFDPEIGYVYEGLVVSALVDRGDDPRFRLDLRAALLGPVTAMRERSVPSGNAGAVGAEAPKAEEEGGEESPRPEAKVEPVRAAPGAQGKGGVVELPEQDIQAFLGDAVVPAGRFVAFESSRPGPGPGRDGSVAVLLVKVVLVRND